MNLHRAFFYFLISTIVAASVIVGVCPALHAQIPNLEFETFTTANGLSQNEVFSIVQDKEGFIWFGTDEGLNRFDGYEFRVFKHEDNNPNSLADNSIHALLIDDEGTLWIGTANGLCRYYPKTEKIERLLNDYTDDTKPNGTGVNKMSEDAHGNIWIAYLGSGLDMYDPHTKKFTHYGVRVKGARHLNNDYVIWAESMPGDDILLGTRSGIHLISPAGKVIDDTVALKKYPWINDLDNSLFSFYLCKDKRTVLIGTQLKGFYVIDLKTGNARNFNTSNSTLKFNNNVPFVFEDSKENIWIGGEAVYRFDRTSEVLIPYDDHGRQRSFSVRNPILSIFEDKDQDIWFGTYRLGVLKYSLQNNQFMHFASMEEEASQSDQVLSFNEDNDGNIWVGTDGNGLFKLRANYQGFDKAPRNNEFSSQVIKCIYKDDKGWFWMGTWDGGMMRYNPLTSDLKFYNQESGNFKSRNVWDIKGDTLGNLWIGTLRDGLCYFSSATGKYTFYENSPDDSTSLVNNDVISLFIDSQHILWIGTSNGLSVLYPGETKFKNLSQEKYLNLNLNILSMYEDVEHRMWLGTNGGGIIIVDKQLNILKTISEKDGLTSSSICAMQKDDAGSLWISTYNGLLKMDVNDYHLLKIPSLAGLKDNQFIPRSAFNSSTGMLLFGGVNGFSMFKPGNLHFNQRPGQVVFTSLRVLNNEIYPDLFYQHRKILSESITATSHITLSNLDYSFTLTFSPLLFNWQQGIRYTYFLENFDKEWQFTTSDKRYIHYTNLSPGEYTLRVKASIDGVNWSTETKNLTITITPPWWGTTLFRAVMVLFLLMALWGIYTIRVRFLHRRKQKLEDLVKMRTHELEKSNQEIQWLLKEVDAQKISIVSKNEELVHINEELESQNDTLETKQFELQHARERLEEINQNLEQLIDKRTTKLNETLLELETFLYRASHDLRGPISSMLGLVKVAELEYDSNPFSRKYIEFQRKSIIKLERTLQKLIQEYTILKSKATFEMITRQTINELLTEVTLVMPSFRPENFEVNVDNDVLFTMDRVMLGIILTNLLDNAFFFSANALNKKVVLDVRKKSDYVAMSFTDYGPGIKDDIRDKIFTMFYRGNELSTGNGLGLYLVKSALGKVNGGIEVESEEGKFTRFIVSFRG